MLKASQCDLNAILQRNHRCVSNIDAHKDNETSPKLPNNVKKDVKYREF